MAIVDRHAVLRTRYEMDGDGSFCQRVSAYLEVRALLYEGTVAHDEAAEQKVASQSD